MRTILFFLAAPFMLMDHCLSYLRVYRWFWGGHWEHWLLGGPCNGDIWVRIKREDCHRMTGERPKGLGLWRGTAYCEERGQATYPTYTLCECGRDLTRAPGAVRSYEGDPETSAVIGYSCPCGRWPRFLWGFGWEYLGDAREVGK